MEVARKVAALRFIRTSGVGLSAIGLLTFIGWQLHINALLISCVYLITVTLLSLTGDFVAVVLVSLAAFGCLDYFFIEPLYSFRVSGSANIAALLASLVTALVITRLVSKVRAEARDSLLQRQRLERLYRLAQELLALGPTASLETEFLASFVGVFGVTAVCLFDAETTQLSTAGEWKSTLAARARDAHIMGNDVDDGNAGVTVRRLQSARGVSATIAFEGLEEPAFTAGPLTALAATFLDRTRALRTASEAAAAAQAELYRSAVLDALAHEFKTPLATILAAAGGIREVGPLLPAQADMADTVESEAARLGSLTSRLLRTARLDVDEIKPRMELIDMTSLVHQIATQYSNRSLDRRIVRAYRLETVEVLADAELLRLPVSQLIENACKYSQPGSIVTIEIEREDDQVALSVTNNRSSIPAGERQRIFERFYRGEDAKRSTSGSGLGLYVARKIALAHGGRLELKTESNGHGRVTFCLTIPGTKKKPTMPLAHNSVLVVDDEATLRKTLRTSLTASGFAVEEARSGEEALQSIQNKSFRPGVTRHKYAGNQRTGGLPEDPRNISASRHRNDHGSGPGRGQGSRLGGRRRRLRNQALQAARAHRQAPRRSSAASHPRRTRDCGARSRRSQVGCRTAPGVARRGGNSPVAQGIRSAGVPDEERRRSSYARQTPALPLGA